MSARTQVDLSNPVRFVLVREFEAPRSLVWKCWTDPEHLAAWWGPDGMTNSCEIDLRVGGKWNVTMSDAAGNEYPIRSTILEVQPEDFFAGALSNEEYDPAWHEEFKKMSGGEGSGILQLAMRVVFEELGDKKTRVTMTQTFPSPAQRDANVQMGAEAGWGQSFIKLDGHLALITR